MKNVFFAVLTVFLFGNVACGQARYDSHSLEPTYIQPGDDVDLYVKFHESLTKRDIYATQRDDQGAKVPLKSDSKAYYIARITPKDAASAKYILVKQERRNVGNVFPGETWSSSFSFHVMDDAPATNYTLAFEVLKTDLDGDSSNAETVIYQDITVKVSGEPKFTFNSDSQLNAGEKATFRVTAINIGGGIARESVMALNATSPLTVLKSASTSLGDVKPSETKVALYEVYIDSRAEPKAYTIPLRLTYTDRTGAKQTVDGKLGVKVTGSPIVAANIDSVSDLTGGKSGTVTLSVVNRGFMDAKFLSIDVLDTDQYTVESNKNVYIGNLASDDFETEEFNIRVADGVSGSIPLKARVSYTEENNNVGQVKDFTFDMKVLTGDEYEKLHPTANGTQQLLSVVFVIPILVVGYFAVWFILKLVGTAMGYIDRKVFRRN